MNIRPFQIEDAIQASRIICECFQKLDLDGHTKYGFEKVRDIYLPEGKSDIVLIEMIKYLHNTSF